MTTGLASGRWRRPAPDTLLTAVALPLGVVTNTPGGDWSGLPGWRLTLVLLAWVPLLVRNRWPLPVLAVAAALDTADIAVASPTHPSKLGDVVIIPIATMLALYTVSNRARPAVVCSLAAAVAVLQFAVAAAIQSKVNDNLLYFNWVLVAVALGWVVRERRVRIAAAEARAEDAERTKQAEAERQVTAERMRIARELHDVLAHRIAVVNAQAGVAQYLMHTDPDSADKALAGITDNTRAALDELRATLGLLRDESAEDRPREPTPGSTQLDSLIVSFTDAGTDVALDVRGSPRPLSGPADVALYRVTQEALTNAKKHAPGAAVQVGVAWSDRSVQLTVTNAAPPAGTLPPGSMSRGSMSRGSMSLGTGHGLIGMRERADVAGGSLSVGSTPDGGYRVALTLPVVSAGEVPEQPKTRETA